MSLNKCLARLLPAILLMACNGAVLADPALWKKLAAGGHVLLLRHASTDPGVGDPPGFRLEDCTTQRNLSAGGREEARNLGKALQQRGIPVAAVRSSRWCRCLETARLAFDSKVQPWPALDNTFETPDRRPQQMREIRKWLTQPVSGGNVVLVTHGVNILALTGISPAEAEIVAIRAGPNDQFSVVGRGKP